MTAWIALSSAARSNWCTWPRGCTRACAAQTSRPWPVVSTRRTAPRRGLEREKPTAHLHQRGAFSAANPSRAGGGAREAAVSEPHARGDLWARHTERVPEALGLGHLDFYCYGLLKFFTDQLARPGSRGKVAYTLAQLMQETAWPHSRQWLRKKLRKLKQQGWLCFEVEERQQGPWVFWLPANSLPTACKQPANSKPAKQEQPPEGANPQSAEGSGAPSLPSPRVRAREEGERERDKSKTGQPPQETSGSSPLLGESYQQFYEQAIARGANPGNEEQPTAPEGANGSDPRLAEPEGEPQTLGELIRTQPEALAEYGTLGQPGVGDPLCRYPAHRHEGKDWLNGGGRWLCGVCCPPADPARLEAQR
jgi:hypothetical protein